MTGWIKRWWGCIKGHETELDGDQKALNNNGAPTDALNGGEKAVNGHGEALNGDGKVVKGNKVSLQGDHEALNDNGKA